MKLNKLPIFSPKQELPLIPMRELVVFPYMVIPFFAEKGPKNKALEAAMASDRMVFFAYQKNLNEPPEETDFHETGTVAKILQMLKLPDGTVRVLAEGKHRARLTRTFDRKGYPTVSFSLIESSVELNPTIAALMNTVQDAFGAYGTINKKIPKDSQEDIRKAEHPDKLVDLVCAHVPFRVEKKIELLSSADPEERLEILAVALEGENQVLQIQSRITSKVKKKLERNQREYFLNEQLKEINRELGRDDQDSSGTNELLTRIEERQPPQEVLDKAKKESARLGKLQPMSPESGVLRTYLEWIADLPWSSRSEDNRDIDAAARILDEDHFNMKKPKERILDFIAVRQLNSRLKGPILCFVGPPGTGKTSLGKSVARALNREFIRISLGGVRDEAEIRGHRKTYVGALPGKIIQGMKRAENINPVFLLDEIDKLNSDFRGDPASAMLEVLDPEQNNSFVDHYLEVPYDLSEVMFITTANSTHSIPYPLLDRMEIIEVPGYSDYEKAEIAKRFIVPKQLEENGLSWANVKFQDKALMEIINSYTMESGVRNLEREIATVIRKTAREAVKGGYTREEKREQEHFTVQITPKKVRSYLGQPRYQRNDLHKERRAGIALGLAWTEMGGTLLPVEVGVFEGSGELILTGSLGDVMKESARAALSFLRTHAEELALDTAFAKERDIHIHVPEGAIPKDGPSAGITLTSAMLSAFTGHLVREGIAMTGEITLTGLMLPIGGVKEKVLAAYRNDLNEVLLPERNRKDALDLPREVTGKLKLRYASSIREALGILFTEYSE
ncbi:endopeptidase La [Marispirochaeta aestuarii]|uniref:endopeptidase La n=1 Tax=Marispirochaeta aestuarii TaxID=1963862 RepID=UPI002ABD624B|nr:endopeptidase La [Marispirochaeta aestuarii]